MRILIICHEFPPLGGGAANAALYLAREFSKMEHGVTILTSNFRNNKPGLDFNAEFVYLPVLRRYIDRASPLELASFALSAVLYALFFVRRNKYDVCLAIHGIPSGWVALFMHKVFKIPYIVSLRGGDVPGFLPQSYDRLHKKVSILTDMFWRNARLLIANSLGLKEIADQTANRIGKSVEVIPNGIDSRFFIPDYARRDNGTIWIVYAGRITLQKGLEDFIDALILCRPKIKNKFSFDIIGEGALKTRLKTKYASLVKEGVLIFSDWLNKEELLMKYQKAHIFALPSLYEGMSNSLLEAMACGCMVIASNIAGSNELVVNGKNGFLFDLQDKTALAEVLVKVLNSKHDDITEMGRASRQIAERYGWDEAAKKYIDYFDRINA